MERKLKDGEAIDVSVCEKTAEGCYRLIGFEPDVDYCDAKTEEWIWSIGQNDEFGFIEAATDARFYQKPGWTCLWLR